MVCHTGALPSGRSEPAVPQGRNPPFDSLDKPSRLWVCLPWVVESRFLVVFSSRVSFRRYSESDPIPPLVFGAIQGRISQTQQLIHFDGGGSGTAGDSQAHCDADSSFRGFHRGLGKHSADTFGHAHAARWDGSRNYDQKLFSSVSPQAVVGSQTALHPLRRLPKYRIACQVPVDVIHLLEMIQVGHDEADGSALPLSSGQFRMSGFQDRGTETPAMPL